MFKITKVNDDKESSKNPEQMKLKRHLTENILNKENTFNKYDTKVNVDKKNTYSMEAESLQFLNFDIQNNKENINNINKICKTQIIINDNSKFANLSISDLSNPLFFDKYLNFLRENIAPLNKISNITYKDYQRLENEKISFTYSKDFFYDCMSNHTHPKYSKNILSACVNEMGIKLDIRKKVFIKLYQCTKSYDLSDNSWSLAAVLFDRIVLLNLLINYNIKNSQEINNLKIEVDNTIRDLTENSLYHSLEEISDFISSLSIKTYDDYLIIGCTCLLISSKFHDRIPIKTKYLKNLLSDVNIP